MNSNKKNRKLNFVENWIRWPEMVLILILASSAQIPVGLQSKSIPPAEIQNPPHYTFSNSRGKTMSLLADVVSDSRGLVFIANGLGGWKETADMTAIAQALNAKGYTAVRFDPTNSAGESEGDISYALPTNYYSDLRDVVGWARLQDWYAEPFYLAGHSMGAMSSALYAMDYPGNVAGIAMVSSIVSGKGQIGQVFKKDREDWILIKAQLDDLVRFSSQAGQVDWVAFWADFLRFDLVSRAESIQSPVIMITGEHDQLAPVDEQRRLYDAMTVSKQFYIIEGAGHIFRDEDEYLELAGVVADFVEGVDRGLSVAPSEQDV